MTNRKVPAVDDFDGDYYCDCPVGMKGMKEEAQLFAKIPDTTQIC